MSKDGVACIFRLQLFKYSVRRLLDIEDGCRTLLQNSGKDFSEYLDLNLSVAAQLIDCLKKFGIICHFIQIFETRIPCHSFPKEYQLVPNKNAFVHLN